MASTSSVLRRALLYVPASSPKMLAKSLTLTSDNITYDLEDSVTSQNKSSCRTALRHHLSSLSQMPSSIGELAVRINAVSTTWALDDLTAVAAVPNVDAIVVPKVNSASDLSFVTDVLRHVCPERHPSNSTLGNPVKLIALVESARAVMDLGSICRASPYLAGLIFAAEDFALDMSLRRTPGLTEFLYARSAVVTATKAFSLASAIDLVCTSFKGPEGLRQLEDECKNGLNLGFTGKQCIHPSQLETVQRLFAPQKEEVEWAIRVVIADERANTAGRGAWTLDGKMIDAPVVGKARSVLAKAEACGLDVTHLREKWKEQQPE